MEIEDLKLKEYNKNELFKKWFVSFIILPIIIYLIFTRGNYSWIDNADLVIREAGHFFFMFFGKFIYTAGGTLMQMILPLLLTWFFLEICTEPVFKYPCFGLVKI